jgi:hypothetical protein
LTGRNTAKAWLVRSYQLLPLAGVDGGAQFLDEDGVGAAQQVGVFLLHLAQDAHAQARAGERVAVDHVARQAQRHAQFAHLVLEQVAQRLQQLQAQRSGRPPTLWWLLMVTAFLLLAPPDSITSG